MQKTLTLAVMSGKGGVGKTNITLNAALALTRLGQRVLVMDGDLGLANIDVLLGCSPEHSLQDVLTGGLAPEEAITEARPGLDLLPAASGADELVTLTSESARTLADSLTPALGSYDFVLLAPGPGRGHGRQRGGARPPRAPPRRRHDARAHCAYGQLRPHQGHAQDAGHGIVFLHREQRHGS